MKTHYLKSIDSQREVARWSRPVEKASDDTFVVTGCDTPRHLRAVLPAAPDHVRVLAGKLVFVLN